MLLFGLKLLSLHFYLCLQTVMSNAEVILHHHRINAAPESSTADSKDDLRTGLHVKALRKHGAVFFSLNFFTPQKHGIVLSLNS